MTMTTTTVKVTIQNPQYTGGAFVAENMETPAKEITIENVTNIRLDREEGFLRVTSTAGSHNFRTDTVLSYSAANYT